MKKFKVFLCVSIFISSLSLFSQATDIPVETLPPEVKAVLEKYVDILRNSGSLDNAAPADSLSIGVSVDFEEL